MPAASHARRRARSSRWDAGRLSSSKIRISSVVVSWRAPRNHVSSGISMPRAVKPVRTVGIVQDGGRDARVRLARVPAAGTAVEARRRADCSRSCCRGPRAAPAARSLRSATLPAVPPRPSRDAAPASNPVMRAADNLRREARSDAADDVSARAVDVRVLDRAGPAQRCRRGSCRRTGAPRSRRR